MLFRKVGAEKEEGRLKEDSLSETLRVLETATGLGEPKCPQNKNKTTQQQTHYTKGGATGERAVVKTTQGNS